MNCSGCGSRSVSVEVGHSGIGRLIDLVVRAGEDDPIEVVRCCWKCGWRETRIVSVDPVTVDRGDPQVAARERLLNELLALSLSRLSPR